MKTITKRKKTLKLKNKSNSKTKKKTKRSLKLKPKSNKKKITMKKTNQNGLYTQSPMLKEYFFKVSSLHTLYVSTYGNPTGKPVLYVHGGPGGGTSPDMARFFNPKLYYIILVDQRGCGKSTPSAELRENTTKHLIADFEIIRKRLGVDKWMVYGGSWGSTLSLAYAFKYPQRVTELILRGIYFCTDQEVHWLSEPNGAENIRPDVWNYYAKQVKGSKAKSKKLFIDEYSKCFKGKYGEKKRDKCLLAWSVWENSMSNLNMKSLKDIIQETKESKYKQMSLIELHYFEQNCFVKPNYFLKKENLNKIKKHKIPVVIVQGMYDLVCPFITAYKLHKALPNAEFYPTFAGHSAFDKENVKALVAATNKFVS